ncbi:hypothetical protein BC628DRAFT_82838 [Trametes gibbosa]|nr:hypothetical protein BC628DRAFT_82838 [Trametes gibbosa]
MRRKDNTQYISLKFKTPAPSPSGMPGLVGSGWSKRNSTCCVPAPPQVPRHCAQLRGGAFVYRGQLPDKGPSGRQSVAAIHEVHRCSVQARIVDLISSRHGVGHTSGAVHTGDTARVGGRRYSDWASCSGQCARPRREETSQESRAMVTSRPFLLCPLVRRSLLGLCMSKQPPPMHISRAKTHLSSSTHLLLPPSLLRTQL